VLLPGDLPGPSATPQFRTFSWDLDSISGLGGFDLTVELIQFDAESYLLRNPRIVFPAGASMNIYLKSIKFGTATAQIDVNNPPAISAQYPTYSAVDTITVSNNPFATSQPLMQIKDGPGLDYIFVSADAIEITSGSGAGLAFFKNNFVPAVSAVNCDNCHYVGGSGPYHIFNYNQVYLRLSTPGSGGAFTPTNNLLINNPTQTNGETHGGGLQCNNVNSSPCNLIQQWWVIENNEPGPFGPNP
jgi:hypothetical protein